MRWQEEEAMICHPPSSLSAQPLRLLRPPPSAPLPPPRPRPAKIGAGVGAVGSLFCARRTGPPYLIAALTNHRAGTEWRETQAWRPCSWTTAACTCVVHGNLLALLRLWPNLLLGELAGFSGQIRHSTPQNRCTCSTRRARGAQPKRSDPGEAHGLDRDRDIDHCSSLEAQATHL